MFLRSTKLESELTNLLEVTIVEEGQQLKIDYRNSGKINNGKPHSVPVTTVNTSAIYRPIQYLGAKHRPLPIILNKALETVRPNTYVLDLFSGSTLVSQIFNLNGLNVISNDALRFNSAFSNSLLNVDRGRTDLQEIPSAIIKLNSFKLNDKFTKPFAKVIAEENKLLLKKDTKKLLQVYTDIPQVHKVLPSNEESVHQQPKSILNNIGQTAFNNYPLIANYYAGSYFSIYQALELDRLRNGIEHLYVEGEVSKWQYHFFITCLLNVSSKIVYTAGKHFAQPIKPENTLKTNVLHKRFYEDRLKDVWNEFLAGVDSLTSVCERNYLTGRNISLSKTMEEIVSDTTLIPPTSVIYADPPYTAQQYSRFYHIPEVIFNYRYPQLQIVKGKVTSGLYPDDKFKSRFCSKKDAHNAFADLFKLAAHLDSSLMISYSSSLTEETGNSRMIEVEQIIELAYKFLPACSIEVLKFNFQYRQLNTAKKIVQAKDDKEFLLVFKQPLQ